MTFCAVCMCDTLSTGRVVKRGLFYRASVVAEYRRIGKKCAVEGASGDFSRLSPARFAGAEGTKSLVTLNFNRQPPREVSRYLAFMSLPVSYMVSITLSSETRGSLVRRIAIRAALIALTEAMALRSMHGTCTLTGDRITGQAEVVFHADLRRHANLFRAGAEQFSRPPPPSSRRRPPRPDSRLPRRKWTHSSYTARRSPRRP